jgi:carbonic anhydrase
MSLSRLVARGLAVALVFLAGCGGGSGGSGSTAEGPAWNHNPADANAGPRVWGEIDESFEQCRTGKRQSPVDIARTVSADLPELEFSYPPTPFVVKNTGHVVEATMPEASNLTLTIGNDVYRLVQFHFHAPSEHTLDGRRYPAEIHLVHESEQGELAVVGVFVEPSALPSPLIDEVVESAPGDAGEEVEIADALSPLDLLLDFDPPRALIDRYYTYPGSLTTPGCTEGVRWIVLQDIHVVDLGTVEVLHSLIGDFPGYDGYPDNNRKTQPLNGRKIELSRG